MSRYFYEQKTVERAIEQAREESKGVPTPCVFDDRYIDMYGNIDGEFGLAFPCGCLLVFAVTIDGECLALESESMNKPDNIHFERRCEEHK